MSVEMKRNYFFEEFCLERIASKLRKDSRNTCGKVLDTNGNNIAQFYKGWTK